MTIDTSRCPPHPLSLQLLALKGDGVARRCEIHHADSPQYRIIRRADSDVDPFSDVVARLTSQGAMAGARANLKIPIAHRSS